MSGPDDRLWTAAQLLGVDVDEMRRYVAEARTLNPRASEDQLVSMAIDAAKLARRNEALRVARESIRG